MRPTPIALAPMVGRHHDGAPLRIGNPINVANPGDKQWTRNRYLFSFGAIGSTFILAYGNGLEDALETAAELLVEREWWGHITPHERVKSSDDLGCDCEDPFECESHTYTGSGWLTSCEWGVTADPTNKDLQNLHWNR